MPAAGKPRPSLFFTRDYQRLLKKNPELPHIESQVITNVVLLVTLARSAAANRRHGAWYRGSGPRFIQTSDVLAPFSQEPARSRAAHYRVSVADGGGKFLIFGTQNVIRAGKHTHADAVASTSRFLRALRRCNVLHRPAYVSVFSCPNTVVTGRFAHAVDPAKLDADWRVSSSQRFPGKAVSIPQCRVVPEIYTSDHRFIMPGVTNPKQLLQATLVIDDVAKKAALDQGSAAAPTR